MNRPGEGAGIVVSADGQIAVTFASAGVCCDKCDHNLAHSNEQVLCRKYGEVARDHWCKDFALIKTTAGKEFQE